tara:strand:+ start:727 stop:1026 length:300 start_codon:yes stop_codon:yes gene_type:complete
MYRALELLKGKEEVGPNVFMSSDEILSISMDNDLTFEEKKGLFSGKYKPKLQIIRDKAKRIEEETKKLLKQPALTDQEIIELNPVFIDSKIETSTSIVA